MRYVRVQAGCYEYHSGIQTAVLVDEPAFNAPPAVLGELAVLGNGRFQRPAECVALYRNPTTTLRRVERIRRWF